MGKKHGIPSFVPKWAIELDCAQCHTTRPACRSRETPGTLIHKFSATYVEFTHKVITRMTRLAGLHFKRTDFACALAFLAYSSSAIMTPMCLLKLMEELDFSLSEGGVIEVVRVVLLLVILVAGGIAAARWGKPVVMLWGSLFLAAGMFSYAIAPAYGVVLAAMALVGIGGGVIEGLVNPMVQDAHPDDSGRYLNIVNAFWSVGILTSVLITGILLTRGVSWRTLIACSGLLGVLSGVIFFRLMRTHRRNATGRSTASVSEVRESWGHIRTVLVEKRFWVFAAAMFFGAGAEGAFTFWSASYIQIYYETLPNAAGYGTAIFAGGMIAGRMLSGKYVHQNGLRRLILFSAIIGIVISGLVYVVGGVGGFYVVLFCAGLSVACFWPSIQSYTADCLDVDTTMLFILLSCGGVPGFGFASWLMGIIGDSSGIRASFTVIPIFLFILACIIWIDHVIHRKSGKPIAT